MQGWRGTSLTQGDPMQDVVELLGVGEHDVEEGGVDGPGQQRVHLNAAGEEERQGGRGGGGRIRGGQS